MGVWPYALELECEREPVAICLKQKLIVYPMAQEDITDVTYLEKVCFGTRWHPTSFQRELANPNSIHFVARLGTKAVGFFGYWLIIEEAHITSVAVLPQYRRMKIAQFLLLKLMEDCIKKNVKWATLEVKETNIPAQELYKKFGFTIYGKRKRYYQDDDTDAFVLWTDDINTPKYRELLDVLKDEIIWLNPIYYY